MRTVYNKTYGFEDITVRMEEYSRSKWYYGESEYTIVMKRGYISCNKVFKIKYRPFKGKRHTIRKRYPLVAYAENAQPLVKIAKQLMDIVSGEGLII